MSKKITKINKLKKLESFLQINYIKGFKYVDRAGEFINALYKDDKFPSHRMDPNGLIAKITDKKEIKVSPHNLWVHFVEPVSFDEEKRELLEKSNLVNSIFEPQKYTRIGWRNYFAHEVADVYPEIIPEKALHGGVFQEIIFNKVLRGFEARISVSRVINQETLSKAILFDIDLFKTTDILREDFSEILGLLGDMESVYKSEELLSLINSILGYE